MKRLLTIIAAAFLTGAATFAQDAQAAAAAAAQAIAEAEEAAKPVEKPRYWALSSAFDLGFNQTSLTNWAAGGFNTITLAAGIDASANYARNLLSWNNRLQLNYAFQYTADKKGILQKSNDRIYLESLVAYKTGANSKWNYTASLDFRSQFTDTYDYVADAEGKWGNGALKSGFMSPAYINLALGMEWKPADWFNINIAPLTGSVVTATNPILRPNYGMPLVPGTEDQYKSVLFQFGAQLKANANFSINDKFFFETQVVAFTDYFNKPFKYIRVNWDNKITWQAAKFFKIGLSTWLIYDPIVVIDDVMSKVQFKEFLSLSFTYTLASKKK
ncbi:MAG: DUF3078 domain-containing protein [Bacteroidales bacterium]|nr:DUF3078 domain-containing protein [Bacteroidales bacterium]